MNNGGIKDKPKNSKLSDYKRNVHCIAGFCRWSSQHILGNIRSTSIKREMKRRNKLGEIK